VVFSTASGLIRWRCCRGVGVLLATLAACVRWAWCEFGRKPPLTRLSVGMVAALLGVALPAGGIMAMHLFVRRAGLSGEDLVLLWACDGGALASCPPWRCCSWSPVPLV
jgi:hypothetical protein